MPEPIVKVFSGNGSNIQKTEPSKPTELLEVKDRLDRIEESLIHPIKLIKDHIETQQRVIEKLQEIVNDNLLRRSFVDTPISIGNTVNWFIDYQRHLYVYIYSNTGFTLVASNGATKSIVSNRWVDVSFPRGTLITAQGISDSEPITCMLRACDVPMENLTGLASNVFKTIKNVALTAGTPINVWTPASGKRFRLLGWALSSSATSASIIFEDNTGAANEFMRTPDMSANFGIVSPDMGDGFLSSAKNNPLFLDATATGNINGYVFGREE